jgi:protein subunit release factor A
MQSDPAHGKDDWQKDCVVSVVKPPDIGGQQVGCPTYPVRVVHTPTGLTAECGYERSQHKNKATAMQMIEWGLVHMRFPT